VDSTNAAAAVAQAAIQQAQAAKHFQKQVSHFHMLVISNLKSEIH
jgi:hypothetical protein